MKYTQVTREGKVTEPPLAQLTYGALLGGRTAMVADSSNTAKKALTIAVRYAAVRRQFAQQGNSIETQLLDYPIHQRRLLPLVAQAVALNFTGMKLQEMYEDMVESLERLKPGDPSLNDTLEKLKETHATSAGLKAFCTWACLDTIERCRQACGGHGYSAYSNLPAMFNDFAVQCTWEGDNTILSLQAGRALVSSYQGAVKGAKLPPGMQYLSQPGVLAAKSDDSLSLEDIEQAFNTVAANVVKKAAIEYAENRKKGMNKEDAMEACSQSRFIAAKLHTISYIYKMNRKAVEGLEASAEKDALVTTCKLYGLWEVEELQGWFLKYGYFNGAQIDRVQVQVDEHCAEIRKYAIPLIDSFALSDHIINSPLGKYDGSVYESYFAQVQAANQAAKEHPYFNRLIKPLLERNTDDISDLGADMDLDPEIEQLARKAAKAAKPPVTRED
jgi:acyl-CoA oxidase